jgi:hypothetical protein
MPFLSLLALASAATDACPIENAHYALRNQPSITADFRDVNSGREWPSQLVMSLHDKATGRTYWWVPWNGGTNGQQNLASTTDGSVPGWQPPNPDDGPRPLGDVSFIATDAQYGLWDHVPVRGGPAPAHFLIPDLREALWYRTPPDAREGTVREFFDLVSCSRHN